MFNANMKLFERLTKVFRNFSNPFNGKVYPFTKVYHPINTNYEVYPFTRFFHPFNGKSLSVYKSLTSIKQQALALAKYLPFK